MSTQLTAALVAALVGGVVGSAITAWSSFAIARSQRREEAATALWNYHYSLTALAAEIGARFGDLEAVSLLGGDWDEARSALKSSYPYAGYLSTASRKSLFTSAWIAQNTDPWAEWPENEQITYNEVSGLASRLENELDWAFPRRFLDPARSAGRRLARWMRAIRQGDYKLKSLG